MEGVQTYQALVRNFDETSGGYSPAWSPDGQWIACARRDDDKQREMLSLWIVSLNSSQTRRITTDKQDGFCSMPTWSPDSKRIAYVGTLPRSAEKGATPGAWSAM